MTAIPFAITPLEVITDRRLLASDLRVLLALLTYVDRDTLQCFPKRSTLAERIGLSVQRVQQVLTRLADLGWIERQRTGRATLYRITPPTLDQEATGGHRRPQEATQAPTTGFLSDGNTGVSIASIEGTDHLSDQLPAPLALATAPDSATRIDQEQRQRQEQQEREQERQRDQERQARQERHQERQERRIARRQERQATAGTRLEAAQEAVQRVLSVFQTVCNVTYPSNGAIAGKVASAIEQHGEQVLTRVIRHRGQTFRHPTALLRDDLIESISAEIDRAPQEGKPKERRIYGVPLSEIERHAQAGETLEDAALRLYEQRRNSVMRA